jgi:hypothetical protein
MSYSNLIEKPVASGKNYIMLIYDIGLPIFHSLATTHMPYQKKAFINCLPHFAILKFGDIFAVSFSLRTFISTKNNYYHSPGLIVWRGGQ